MSSRHSQSNVQPQSVQQRDCKSDSVDGPKPSSVLFNKSHSKYSAANQNAADGSSHVVSGSFNKMAVNNNATPSGDSSQKLSPTMNSPNITTSSDVSTATVLPYPREVHHSSVLTFKNDLITFIYILQLNLCRIIADLTFHVAHSTFS